jgi:hypothetical protein
MGLLIRLGHDANVLELEVLALMRETCVHALVRISSVSRNRSRLSLYGTLKP